MNKNIIISIIASIVAVGAIFIIGLMQYSLSPSPYSAKIDGAAIEKNLSDLTALDSEMALSSQDEDISNEMDSALNEIGEIDTSAELNEGETSLNGLSSDLADISGDEAVLNELDQTLNEALAN